MADLGICVMGFQGAQCNSVVVGATAILWSLSNTRNDACFNRIYPGDPSIIVGKMTYWVYFWAGL